MEYRPLGNTGLKPSVLCIGSYHTYDRMTEDEIVELLIAARRAGINWFDVGHYTSAAHPELPVSTTDIRFAKARAQAGIARQDYIHTQKLWYGGPRPSFRAQFAESLPRAEIDAADIAIYNPDTAYYFGTEVDMRDVVTQMAGLVRDGLTSFWGINHATPDEVRQACEFASAEGMPLPSVLQLPYSVIARRMAEAPELIAVAEDWGLSYQASNVLAVGILAGRPAAASKRPLGPDGMTQHAEAVAGKFAEIAATLEATPAQLAIAFVLAHPLMVAAITGVSGLSQLEDNLGAVELLSRVGADGLREAVAELPQNDRELAVGQLAN